MCTEIICLFVFRQRRYTQRKKRAKVASVFFPNELIIDRFFFFFARLKRASRKEPAQMRDITRLWQSVTRRESRAPVPSTSLGSLAIGDSSRFLTSPPIRIVARTDLVAWQVPSRTDAKLVSSKFAWLTWKPRRIIELPVEGLDVMESVMRRCRATEGLFGQICTAA